MERNALLDIQIELAKLKREKGRRSISKEKRAELEEKYSDIVLTLKEKIEEIKTSRDVAEVQSYVLSINHKNDVVRSIEGEIKKLDEMKKKYTAGHNNEIKEISAMLGMLQSRQREVKKEIRAEASKLASKDYMIDNDGTIKKFFPAKSTTEAINYLFEKAKETYEEAQKAQKEKRDADSKGLMAKYNGIVGKLQKSGKTVKDVSGTLSLEDYTHTINTDRIFAGDKANIQVNSADKGSKYVELKNGEMTVNGKVYEFGGATTIDELSSRVSAEKFVCTLLKQKMGTPEYKEYCDKYRKLNKLKKKNKEPKIGYELPSKREVKKMLKSCSSDRDKYMYGLQLVAAGNDFYTDKKTLSNMQNGISPSMSSRETGIVLAEDRDKGTLDKVSNFELGGIEIFGNMNVEKKYADDKNKILSDYQKYCRETKAAKAKDVLREADDLGLGM